MALESQQQEASIAVAAIAELDRVHRAFLESAGRPNPAAVNGGFFRAEEGTFVAEALGIPFRVVMRPVVSGGRFNCAEYAFTTAIDERPTQLWQMYLGADGGLYLDAALTQRLCDYNNQYLQSHVVAGIVSKLLRSPVFAPRTGA